MDDKQNRVSPEEELNLDDILKEFGGGTPAPENTLLEEALAQMPIAQEPPLEERLKMFLSQPDEDEDVKRYEPAPHTAAQEQPRQENARTAVGEATVRFEPLNESHLPAAMEDATVRFDPAQVEAAAAAAAEDAPDCQQTGGAASGDTVRFEPLGQPQEETEPREEALPEGAEPFSGGWEPQYEMPMGEYVPPEPIQFRPRSKLTELKQKLVAGPERQYYLLSELGLGKLQAAIFLSLLVVFLSFGAIIMHSMGLVRPERMRLLVFGELFAMVLSALIGSQCLIDGIAALLRRKFTAETMLMMSFLVCIADGIFCLREVRVPFCAAFCLEVTACLWARYQNRNVRMGQMDTLRKAVRLNRVAKAPDCCEGKPGFYVTEGEVEDFMDTYTEPTAPERYLSIYFLLAFLLTAVIAGVSAFFKGVSVGLQTWSAAILAAMPVTVFVCQSRPMAVLERRFHKLGIVLCGWTGVKEMSGAAAVPVPDTALFPAGSMKINGVKFYTRREPDQTVAYAAAIMEQAANALTPLFNYLLDSRNGIHYDVHGYVSYDDGFGAEVNGESVLLGSAAFLQSMGVEIPEGSGVNQAVYVAVEGQLCGVFALAVGKLKGVSAGLGSLCTCSGLTPVIAGNNFLLTQEFLASKFSVSTRRVAFPKGEERQAVNRWQPDAQTSIPCALTTQSGLASMAFAITGARTLRTASNMGAALHIAAGVAGMVMVLILTLSGGTGLLTPANLLLYHLAWCVPGMLVSSWTRYL